MAAIMSATTLSLHAFWNSISKAFWIGVICGAVALLVPAIISGIVIEMKPETAEQIRGAWQQPFSPTFPLLMNAFVYAPLVETCIVMVVVLAFCYNSRNILNVVAATALTGLLSWWGHGASVISIGQGLAFMILAIQFVGNLRSSGILHAYCLGCFSHSIWNMSIFALGSLDLDAASIGKSLDMM